MYYFLMQPVPELCKAEKFLPVELDELADALIAGPAADLGPEFADFIGQFLVEHGASLAAEHLKLKRCYREFNPDRITVSARKLNAGERDVLRRKLHPQLIELLRQANYIELTPEDFEAVLNRVSPRGLQVTVDLEAFDELGLHYRGMATRVDECRDWRYLYLKKRQWNTPIYQRLFLFFKLKPGHANCEDTGRDLSDFLFLKLFRDVPQTDLEMLLPNTKVKMRVFDKVKLGVTGGGGTISGVVATATKVGAAASPATWAIALAGLGGVIWRQITKLFATRTRYMADLAQQLYFCNLDNNFGALAHIADLAREEESKESLLAYAFLAAHPTGLTQQQLDQKVEAFLKAEFGVTVDYEVEDGLAKLNRLGLIHRLEGAAVAWKLSDPQGCAES
jgi:hypothetical protein